MTIFLIKMIFHIFWLKMSQHRTWHHIEVPWAKSGAFTNLFNCSQTEAAHLPQGDLHNRPVTSVISQRLRVLYVRPTRCHLIFTLVWLSSWKSKLQVSVAYDLICAQDRSFLFFSLNIHRFPLPFLSSSNSLIVINIYILWWNSLIIFFLMISNCERKNPSH